MASETPIPLPDGDLFFWSKSESAVEAVKLLNKLASMEIAFGGNRFPIRYSGENALIDLKQTIVSSTSALPALAAYTVLANPTDSLAPPIATASPVLTSVIFGPSGGAVSGVLGAVTIAAAGTDKNITVTPSGQGAMNVTTSSVTNAAIVTLRSATAASSCNLRMFNDQNSTVRTLDLGYSGSTYSGSWFASGGISGESGFLNTSGNFPLQFGTNNICRGSIVGGGRWLVGTATDDSTTLFQVAGAVSATTITLATQVTTPKIVWAANIIDLSGSGSPEGVVTADLGSIYRRNNGGSGTTVYVKESGSGNTGWAAIGAGSSPLTTKGDLFTFTTVSARLPVGANGLVLTADSAEATGLKWSAAGSGTIGGATGGTDNAFIRADGGGGSTVQGSTAATLDDAGIATFDGLLATRTASGGITINNSSSNQPYLLFNIASTSYALIGVNNGVNGAVTGPDKAVYIRAITQSIIFSGDNGTTPGLTISSTNQVSVNSLTAGRVVFAGSNGLLTDDADMTFSGDTFQATKIKGAGLTSTRVVFTTTGGELTDNTNMTFVTDTLTITKVNTTLLTAAGTASGGVTINNTSTNQPYILFQVSGGNTALIGTNNGADAIAPGPDGQLVIRGIASGITLSADNGTTATLLLNTSNNATFAGTITTPAPAGASAHPWKLGSLVTAAVTPDITRSLYVDVNGTVYKLIVST